ncbi:bcl-2-like protein 11 isoform X2 [Triplophysa dalaica]|uniref:bcl-2-like protein 11 isoform X2 n=1 Tax=Triplophysa dalaica TaxID=1582913 RepID=UPI0024DFB696|nr:bcl-2-like protein 11 isoform X2 [Triplophysa dalaica]
MCDPFREQTPAIDSASLSETQGRGESAPGGDSRSEHFPFPQPSDGDPLRVSPLGYQLRSPMSRTFSRSSSGYFSVDSDSVPSSPLMPNISEAQGSQNDVWFADISHQHGQMAAPVAMRHEEILVARELRRIGDDFNRLYFHEMEVTDCYPDGEARWTPRPGVFHPPFILYRKGFFSPLFSDF